jgi:hypothetical protein
MKLKSPFVLIHGVLLTLAVIGGTFKGTYSDRGYNHHLLPVLKFQ